MSRTLTLVFTDEQATKLEESATELGLSIAGFLEGLIEAHLKNPFTQNELLKTFLLGAASEGLDNGLKYGPNDIASRICIDWIAGCVFESRKFGKAVSRAPILGGSENLDELYRECSKRYDEIHRVGKSMAKESKRGKKERH